MARLRRGAEEVRELRSEKRALRAAGGGAASQTVADDRRATRRPVSRSTSRSRNPTSKRALCAASGASPANARKPRGRFPARRSSQLRRADAGERRDRREERAGADERLERLATSSARTRTAPISQIRSRRPRARSSPDRRRRAPLPRSRSARRSRSRADSRAEPRRRVAGDDVSEQRAGERRERARARRAPSPLLRGERARVAPGRARRDGRPRRTRAARGEAIEHVFVSQARPPPDEGPPRGGPSKPPSRASASP